MDRLLLKDAVYYLDTAVLDIHKPEHRCRLATLRAQLLTLARDIATDRKGVDHTAGGRLQHEPQTLHDLCQPERLTEPQGRALRPEHQPGSQPVDPAAHRQVRRDRVEPF